MLVTGSKDTTVMVWLVGQDEFGQYPEDSDIIAERPEHILYGHDDEVTCVAVNSDFDVVVSGSKDGSCIIFTLRKGQYVRSIYPPGGGSLRWIGVSAQAHIVTYSLQDLALHVFDINARHLHAVKTEERLYCMVFSNDGEFLVTGGDFQRVCIRRTFDLRVVHQFPAVNATIRAIDTTPSEQHLLVGLQNGTILIYALNATYLRRKFLHRLARMGF
jgi:WD40 repeat protein